MSKCKLPVDAVVAITYKCNARCSMCSIWQIKDHQEIPAQAYLKLPATLKDINISGGEPFMRPDILQVVKNIKTACPKARYVISSNGLAPALIQQQISQILKIEPNMGVAISLDGTGQIHDQVRGMPGAYEKVLATVKILQNAGVKYIKLAYTLTNENLLEMIKVFDLSKKLGVDFTLAAMQSSDVYFGNKENKLEHNPQELKQAFFYVIKKQLQSRHPKQWGRAFFTFGLYQFIIGKGRKLPPEAGSQHFFLDPRGVIYPSVVDNQNMGSLALASSFEQIWCSVENKALKKELKNGLAKPSWMICTVRSAIKKHPFSVGWWILKNKIKFSL
ncbi:MAG TPA: radical SAM protein [bacterium]|nr:radical SAM protein [bacterium]